MNELSFYEKGNGKPILLIHGFPMNAGIWEKFSSTLTSSFQVITVDLPGFGKSPLLKEPFSIEDIAEVLIDNLIRKGIKKIIPVGHSLGGYVTLAMISKMPSLFPGFGLFHSTAFADSPEKKESRNKTIEFIKKNGAEAFSSNFIRPLFANPDHPDVPFVREMNMKTSEETLLAYTRAMRDRSDKTDVIKQYQHPILFIAGTKDPGIQVSSIQEQAAFNDRSEVKILPEQAHMGLIEDVQTTSEIVYDFSNKCFGES